MSRRHPVCGYHMVGDSWICLLTLASFGAVDVSALSGARFQEKSACEHGTLARVLTGNPEVINLFFELVPTKRASSDRPICWREAELHRLIPPWKPDSYRASRRYARNVPARTALLRAAVTWRFDLKSIRYPSTGSAGRAQPLELSSGPPLPLHPTSFVVLACAASAVTGVGLSLVCGGSLRDDGD